MVIWTLNELMAEQSLVSSLILENAKKGMEKKTLNLSLGEILVLTM